MPIYEYRCTSCQTELEKLQKISDPPLVQCPECGKETLTKLISASSFRLKGSGWYETDFKTGKKKNGAAEESAGTTVESGSASANAGDKAGTKDTNDKSASEGNSRKDSDSPASGSSSSKGETKTATEAKPSTSGAKAKSS